MHVQSVIIVSYHTTINHTMSRSLHKCTELERKIMGRLGSGLGFSVCNVEKAGGYEDILDMREPTKGGVGWVHIIG